MNPLQKQEGGSHYKNCAIQPVEYIHANGLGYIEGAVIKYVTRYKAKNGAEDIKKAIHFLELLLQLEYPANDAHKAPSLCDSCGKVSWCNQGDGKIVAQCSDFTHMVAP